MNGRQGFGFRASGPARQIAPAEQQQQQQKVEAASTSTLASPLPKQQENIVVTDPETLCKSARIVTRTMRLLAARRRLAWAALGMHRYHYYYYDHSPNPCSRLRDDGNKTNTATDINSDDVFNLLNELMGCGATNDNNRDTNTNTNTTDSDGNKSQGALQKGGKKKKRGWVWPWLHYTIFKAAGLCAVGRRGSGVGGGGGLSQQTEVQHSRITFPLSSIIFALLGAPLEGFSSSTTVVGLAADANAISVAVDDPNGDAGVVSAASASHHHHRFHSIPLPTSYNAVNALKAQFYQMQKIVLIAAQQTQSGGSNNNSSIANHALATTMNNATPPHHHHHGAANVNANVNNEDTFNIKRRHCALEAISEEAARRTRQIVSVLSLLLQWSRKSPPKIVMPSPPPLPSAPSLSATCGATFVSSSFSASFQLPSQPTYASVKIVGNVIQWLMGLTTISGGVVAAATAGGGGGVAVLIKESKKHKNNKKDSNGDGSDSVAGGRGGSGDVAPLPLQLQAREVAIALFQGRSDGLFTALMRSSGRDGGAASLAAASSALMPLLATIIKQQMTKHVLPPPLPSPATASPPPPSSPHQHDKLAPAPTMAVVHYTIALHLCSLAAMASQKEPSSSSSSTSPSRPPPPPHSPSPLQQVTSLWCSSGMATAPYLPKPMDTPFNFATPTVGGGRGGGGGGEGARQQQEQQQQQLNDLGNSFLQQHLCTVAMLWQGSFEGLLLAAGPETKCGNAEDDNGVEAKKNSNVIASAATNNASSPTSGVVGSPSHLIANSIYQIVSILSKCYGGMHDLLVRQHRDATSSVTPNTTTTTAASSVNGPSSSLCLAPLHAHDHRFEGSVSDVLDKSLVLVAAECAMGALKRVVGLLGAQHCGMPLPSSSSSTSTSSPPLSSPSGWEEGGAAVPHQNVSDSLSSISSDARQTAMLSCLWDVDPLTSSSPQSSSSSSSVTTVTKACAQWIFLELFGQGDYAEAIGAGIGSQWQSLFRRFSSSSPAVSNALARTLLPPSSLLRQFSRSFYTPQRSLYSASTIPNILLSGNNDDGGGNLSTDDRCRLLASQLWSDGWLKRSVVVSATPAAPSTPKKPLAGGGSGGCGGCGGSAFVPVSTLLPPPNSSLSSSSSQRGGRRNIPGPNGTTVLQPASSSSSASFDAVVPVIAFFHLLAVKAPSVSLQLQQALSGIHLTTATASSSELLNGMGMGGGGGGGGVGAPTSLPPSSASPLSLPAAGSHQLMPLSELCWMRLCVPLLPIVDTLCIAVDTPTEPILAGGGGGGSGGTATSSSSSSASASNTTNAKMSTGNLYHPHRFVPSSSSSTAASAAVVKDQTLATRLLALLPHCAVTAAHIVFSFYSSHFISYGLMVCDDAEVLTSSSPSSSLSTATAAVGLPSLEVLRHIAIVFDRFAYASIGHGYLPINTTSIVSNNTNNGNTPSAAAMTTSSSLLTSLLLAFSAAAPSASPSPPSSLSSFLSSAAASSVIIEVIARYLRDKDNLLSSSSSSTSTITNVTAIPLVAVLAANAAAAAVAGTAPTIATIATNALSSSSSSSPSSSSFFFHYDQQCRKDAYGLRSHLRLAVRQLMDRASRNEKYFIPAHLRVRGGGGGGAHSPAGGGGAAAGEDEDDEGVMAFFEKLLMSRAERERGSLTASGSRLWWVDGTIKHKKTMETISKAALNANSASKPADLAAALQVLTNGAISKHTMHLFFELPHTIPFPYRASLLRLLIADDRRKHHHVIQSLHRSGGGNSNTADSGSGSYKLGLKIRRNHIYSDAFTQLMGIVMRGLGEGATTVADGLLRARWYVSFVDNMTHQAEAGIDQGGVFKEFIELVLKQALDPSYGLFVSANCKNSDGTANTSSPSSSPSAAAAAPSTTVVAATDLYPNPHALQFLSVMFGGGGSGGGGRNAQQQQRPAQFNEVEMKLHYRFVGLLIAKAIYEGIVVNAPFAPFFLQSVLGRGTLCIDDLRQLDPQLYKSLMLLNGMGDAVSDACLTFAIEDQVLGTTVTVDLINPPLASSSNNNNNNTNASNNSGSATPSSPSSSSSSYTLGRDIEVTSANVIRYIHLLANYRLSKSIKAQTDAFVQGLCDVLGGGGGGGSGGGGGNSNSSGGPPPWLRLFNSIELLQLIRGTAARLDVKDLKRHVNLEGGGYAPGDRTLSLLWEVLEEMSAEDQGRFLAFCTGSSRPPLLGFGSMSPLFSIRRALDDATATSGSMLSSGGSIFNVFVAIDRLPSASTCFNLLKLPPYMTKSNLKEKLLQAIRSGAGFDLS